MEHHSNILYKQLCVFLTQTHVWLHDVTSHWDYFVKHCWLLAVKCVKQLCVCMCECVRMKSEPAEDMFVESSPGG